MSATVIPFPTSRAPEVDPELVARVRMFPTLSPDTTELVAFDDRGRAVFKLELPKDEDIEEWALLLRSKARERR